MIEATTFSGKSVALFGLGGSGLATAQALEAGGARVACWDDNAAARDKAAAAGLTLVDLSQADWSGFSSLVLAPGAPLTHPAPHWSVVKAKAAGVEIIGDIEIFLRERAARAPGARLVAITGTNGKSTTTALIAHLYRALGFDAQMGGNIGTPALALEPFAPGRVYILELSTFQIDLTPGLAADVGVLLNLTPDHIDRHGSMEAYAAIKERLVQASRRAVVGVDDDFSRAIAERRRAGGGERIEISVVRDDIDGVFARDGRLWRRRGGMAEPIADLTGVGSLRGAHNWQNAAAAVATLPDGADIDAVRAGLASFPGLVHRMEEVAREGDILYINDSKATNADAAEKALLAFHDIYWIAGGKAKEGGIEPLRPLFGRVKKTFLIGAAAEAFAKTLGEAPHEISVTLDVALDHAARAARAAGRGVVLLSPACASYDQFPNFEKRGDAFRDAVKALLAKREADA